MVDYKHCGSGMYWCSLNHLLALLSIKAGAAMAQDLWDPALALNQVGGSTPFLRSIHHK